MNREEEAVGDDREEGGHALCSELAIVNTHSNEESGTLIV